MKKSFPSGLDTFYQIITNSQNVSEFSLADEKVSYEILWDKFHQ